MAEKTILDGIILKIDNGYPLLQTEYQTLLEELPVVREEKSVGNWDSGSIDYRNVSKKYYVVGNSEKGYFWFYHAKSEWVVDGYLILKEFKENLNKSQKQKFGMNKKKGN